MAARFLIDEPSLVAPIEEWRRFRENLRSLPQDDEAVQYAIERADRQITILRNETSPTP